MKRLVLVISIAVLLAGSACGKDKDESSGSSQRADSSSASSTSSTATTANGSNGSGGTAKTPSGQPAPGTPGAPGGPSTTAVTTEAKPVEPVDVKYSLDKKCVKIGEEQGLTIKTRPKDAVGYSTEYSDGSSSFSKGYKTGDGTGSADEEGDYRATWVISPGVPTGKTILHVVANGVRQTPLEFQIVKASESC